MSTSSLTRARHYRLLQGTVHQPAMLFQINAQFQDVRSGYRDLVRELLVAAWLEEQELDWTPDMVSSVERDWLEEIAPPSELEWPEFGDQKMLRYLTQQYRRRIWRNYALDLYSRSGETKADFVTRCWEVTLGQRESDLERLRELFVRRFLELERKLIERITEDEWSAEWKTRKLARVQELFSRIREDLNRWSLRHDHEMLAISDFDWKAESDPLLQDRLDDLRQDIVSTSNNITRECEHKVNHIDAYEIPLAFSQIEIVSRGIVWNG